MKIKTYFLASACLMLLGACSTPPQEQPEKVAITAEQILGDAAYPALSYGGYRTSTRDNQPTIDQLKEDMVLLHAMGIRILRTYNVHLPHASNLLEAINQLQQERADFEMYLMLGAWIDCKNAWTDLPPDHDQESERNKDEIAKAVELANKYPDIVKIIAVGNEAMVKWATSYFVQPSVILKWVNHLQALKADGKLPKDLWITSSDDFSSWGGGSTDYHTEDLNQLIRSVDYISMHTYPMHNTHYNPDFWGVMPAEDTLSKEEQIEKAMLRSIEFAQMQYDSVSSYMTSLGVDKPIHIGETGWATVDNHHYGVEGSKATDEYKGGRYYDLMRTWTSSANISCFFFEGFDEPWKDAANQVGSENHFGLFTIDGQAKYALWPLVDEGLFDGLSRAGNQIRKTYNGDLDSLLQAVPFPPRKEALVTYNGQSVE